MKKYIVMIVLASFTIACGSNDQRAADAREEEAKPLVSRNTDAFNHSFEKVLSSYDVLKNALIDYDTAAANIAVIQLIKASDSLQLQEIKDDSTGAVRTTAASYQSSISEAAKLFAGSPELEKKKRQFQIISDAFYDLIRTVKYDKKKIYRQHCPMAFNDNEEAFWISESNEVQNPYLGKKHPKYRATMVECGDVADSLDFRK